MTKFHLLSNHIYWNFIGNCWQVGVPVGERPAEWKFRISEKYALRYGFVSPSDTVSVISAIRIKYLAIKQQPESATSKRADSAAPPSFSHIKYAPKTVTLKSIQPGYYILKLESKNYE